jgi:hypothetical protein
MAACEAHKQFQEGDKDYASFFRSSKSWTEQFPLPACIVSFISEGRMRDEIFVDSKEYGIEHERLTLIYPYPAEDVVLCHSDLYLF